MANDLESNPLRCDTAATVIDSDGGVLVQAIQWVDDDGAAGGAIANTEDLFMTVNGAIVQFSVAVVATQLAGAMAYNLLLSAPIRVHSLIVSTIDGGTLLVWTA